MSGRMDVLHSHRWLEKELKFKKHTVLVDEKFKGLFLDDTIEPFKYNGVNYYKVPILSFVNKGGIFKNFIQ